MKYMDTFVGLLLIFIIEERFFVVLLVLHTSLEPLIMKVKPDVVKFALA